MKKYLLITVAIGLLFVSGGFALVQAQRCQRLENTLEEVYLSALHQAVEEMNTLALNMEKLLLATDPSLRATLLSSIGRDAENVQQCLALLPVDHQAMLPTRRFVHQLTESADRLLPLLAAQGELTPDDTRQLSRQWALCSQLCSQLAMVHNPTDLEKLVLEGAPAAQSPAVQARGLPQGDITQEEALHIARAFVGDDRVVSLQAAPGTTGALAAYGVTVQTQDVQLNLEITRQGGKVLWMMPETASFPMTQSLQACRDAASAMLDMQGFGPVQAVHHQVYDGLCVISFAPVQEGVLLYPDLLRVQLRMDTAQVVGLEAHNYWLNHTPRTLPKPRLSQEEARSRIGDQAEVTSWQLCLLPHEQKEVLCHEFTLNHQGETYLLYIDAQSGHELQLLKTIPVENGVLTA